MKRFEVTRRASRDLKIWEFIADDNLDAADRVLEDFYRALRQIADMPGIGHRRWILPLGMFSFGGSTPISLSMRP